jgi:diguanylate cyclase (GGDEF)-like protein
MLKSLMQSLNAWSHWGCDGVESHSLQRKIFHVNVAAFITILSMAFFAVLNALTGNAALIKSDIAQIPFYFFVLAVPWLNRRGHAGFARWLLSLSVTAAIAANIWLANGSWLDLHFYFILIALLGVLFFPLRQWVSIVLLFVVNSSLFVYCGYFGVEPDPALLSLDATTATMFRAAYVSTSLFTLLFITWLGEYVANKNERELEKLSGMDMLTQLPNRRRLEQRLIEKIAVSKRTGQHGAVMFLDLDNFKPLNDTYGHAAGDLLLQEVAQRIRACIRETDMVARFGGDEFVILLSELGTEQEDAKWRANQVAEKIRVTLAEPYRIAIGAGQDVTGQVEHRCTASIGVEMFAGGAMSEVDILKRADAAMYKAKESGRNAISFHEEKQHAWDNPQLPTDA